jgi:hypothetical protein
VAEAADAREEAAAVTPALTFAQGIAITPSLVRGTAFEAVNRRAGLGGLRVRTPGSVSRYVATHAKGAV